MCKFNLKGYVSINLKKIYKKNQILKKKIEKEKQFGI